MNANLTKLEELIKETTNVINNLKLDTGKLKAEYNRNRQHELDEMRDFFKSLIPMIRPLQCNVQVPLKSKSHYGDYYEISLRIGIDRACDPVIYSGRECCLGGLSWGSTYESIKNQIRYSSGLKYDLDDILDGWDQEAFEIAFAEEVQNILVKKAKLANQNYEDTKAKLEKKEVM